MFEKPAFIFAITICAVGFDAAKMRCLKIKKIMNYKRFPGFINKSPVLAFSLLLTALLISVPTISQIHSASFIRSRWIDVSSAGTIDWAVFGNGSNQEGQSIKATDYKKGGKGIQRIITVLGKVELRSETQFQKVLSWNDGSVHTLNGAIASDNIPLTGLFADLSPGSSISFVFDALAKGKQYLASVLISGGDKGIATIAQGNDEQIVEVPKGVGAILVKFSGGLPVTVTIKPLSNNTYSVKGFAAMLSEDGIWWVRDGQFAALYQPIHVEKILADTKSSPDYLSVAKNFADCMIEYGQDRYGKVQSSLFSAILTREKRPQLTPYPLFAKAGNAETSNYENLDTSLPDKAVLSAKENPFNRYNYNMVLNYPQGLGDEGPHKTTLYGCDLFEDKELYMTLFDVSRITNNARYKNEAEKAIRFWFEKTQGPAGLYPWGEHMGWDLVYDTPVYFTGPGELFFEGNYHEVRDFVPFLEYLIALPPGNKGEQTPLEKYALGIWKTHFWDKEKGFYNRHGDYRGQVDQTNELGAFPAHLAFYMRIWAAAYLNTKSDSVKEQLASQYHKTLNMALSRTRKYGFYPFQLGVDLKGEEPGKTASTQSIKLAHHCVWLAGQLQKVLPDVADSLRVFAKLHLGKQTEEQTMKNLKWAEVLGDASFIENTGDTNSLPEPSIIKDLSKEVMSGAFANEILQNVWYYRVTGNKEYLKTADKYARVAYASFCDGKSPLPRAFAKGIFARTVYGKSFPDFYFKGARLMRAFALLGEAQKI